MIRIFYITYETCNDLYYLTSYLEVQLFMHDIYKSVLIIAHMKPFIA
jgi:hypothetical protein